MPRTGFYEPLSLQDGSFIVFEGPETHMHVAAVGLFEARAGAHAAPDIDRLRAHVEAHLDGMPHHRQRLAFTPVEGRPIWVDDPGFNLRYHVRHTSLPRPGAEEQLKELVARILSQQLDRAKPLWELWLVEGLEGDRFALVTKVHHCMADGVSGLGLIRALLSDRPGSQPRAAAAWSPRPRPGRLRLLGDAIADRVTAPVSAIRALSRAASAPLEGAAAIARGVEALGQALRSGLRIPVETPLNRTIGTHRRVDWRDFDLAEIKRLKSELGVTVNDIVLSVVAGAVRRFLLRHDALVEALDFRIVIPVNMRTASGVPGSSEGSNHVSAWFVSLPVDEPDPRRRVERTSRETRDQRASGTAQGIELFTQLTEWTRSPLLARLGVRFAASMHPYNMIVTNVPGPREPLYLLGARLETLYPHLPLFEDQGLGVAVVSYLDRVCFGLVADWDVVPDLADVASDLDAAFDELRGLLDSPRRSSEACPRENVRMTGRPRA